ncbi:hypothetical protein UFOVP67_33 [uncultured Caudovirales phage]|uniref:Terminase small subunit n=1 Tax=uncultured Caudovirales phage TaxID=2100421 RepID=A0A6J5T8Q1_9CAUD|nr:hypothetical protein UFOVP67_33 [uncultured Caudovirales phage]
MAGTKLKRRSRTKTGGSGWWSDKHKLKVVETYLRLGSAPKTEIATGVPQDTIRHWKMTPWWKEIATRLEEENKGVTDQKLTTLLDKSLAGLEDRIDNGDTVFDQKTGQMMLKPVSASVLVKVASTVFDKRNTLREQTADLSVQKSVNERLSNLLKQFATKGTDTTKPVVEATDVAFVEIIKEIDSTNQ